MKRFTFLSLILIIACLSTSCEKWLEGTSATKIPADKLFETRAGFEDALSGVYINLGSSDLYGSFATWFGLDQTAYPYNEATNSSERRNLQRHVYDFSYVKTDLASLWLKAYNVIANINLALRNIDNNVLTNQNEYNLYKGELLGLRAMVHFDMLRMFGTANWDSENASKLTIPYETDYTAEFVNQLSYAQTEELLLADLNASIEALRASDPLLMNSEDAANFQANCNTDGYWNNRTKHLNYYAVLALAARVYQWKNDLATAASYAQQVIDGAMGSVVNWIDIDAQLTASSDDARDWTFSCEHLFSLEVTNLFDLTQVQLFDISGTSYGINISNQTIDNYLFVRYNPETGSNAGAEDVRGPALQLRIGGLGYYCYKLYCSTSYYAAYRNRIPMMKISEMYYILAENYIAQGQNQMALQMLDEVRTHRGIGDLFPSQANADSELMLEYYREFICEGQLFYYLKHKQISESPIPTFSVNYTQLIFPYPDKEINYGRIQEL